MREIKMILAFICLVLLLVACSTSSNIDNSSQSEVESIQIEEVSPIVSSVQFSGVSEVELIKLVGDPESKDSWNFNSTNGQTYDAVTWTYDKGNQEFLFIDDKVVRFTYYGDGENYEDADHAFSLFGITKGPNITKVSDTGSALRYQRVDESMKVDEFWLVEDLSAKSIGTVKITYDSRYF